VETGSHSNQVYADCVDLSAVENASKQKTRTQFCYLVP
jgi:ribonuclease P protein component